MVEKQQVRAGGDLCRNQLRRAKQIKRRLWRSRHRLCWIKKRRMRLYPRRTRFPNLLRVKVEQLAKLTRSSTSGEDSH